MRGQRGQEQYKRLHGPARPRRLLGEVIDTLHHAGDGRVELQLLNVPRDSHDGPVQDPVLVVRGLDVLYARVQLQGFRAIVHDHPPRAIQEPAHPLDPLHTPGLRRLQRSHEHLVQSERIAPNSRTISSGFTTLPRLFDIL